jgi:hypothetical protein
MNYQVDWNGEGEFENVIPDGYGMHVEHIATFDNVLEENAHIIDHGNIIRIVDNCGNNDPESARYEIRILANDLDSHPRVIACASEEEARSILEANYTREQILFDDDYECDGCWSPESGDPDVWFAAIFEQGAEAARCGHGCVDQYEYTAQEWSAKTAA